MHHITMFLVNNRPHIPQWSHNIIMELTFLMPSDTVAVVTSQSDALLACSRGAVVNRPTARLVVLKY